MNTYTAGYSIAMPQKPSLILLTQMQVIILLYTHSAVVRQMNFMKTMLIQLKSTVQPIIVKREINST